LNLRPLGYEWRPLRPCAPAASVDRSICAGQRRFLGPPRSMVIQSCRRESRCRRATWDRHVHRADPGVEVPVTVAVARVGPIGAAGAVLGPADRVGLRAHQGIDERGQQVAQQVWGGVGQLLVQEPGRLDTGSSGHRMLFSRVDLVGLSKNHAVAAYTSTTAPSPGPVSHTTLRDATHRTCDGSSKPAERLWQDRIYRMSFCLVRRSPQEIPSSQVKRTFVCHDPLRTPHSPVDRGSALKSGGNG